jgi:hypothetical protein
MAAKKRASAGCDCIAQVNAELESRNTRLVTSILLRAPGAMKRQASLDLTAVIATERIENRRDGKRATVVLPTFCPFCGKKIPKP